MRAGDHHLLEPVGILGFTPARRVPARLAAMATRSPARVPVHETGLVRGQVDTIGHVTAQVKEELAYPDVPVFRVPVVTWRLCA